MKKATLILAVIALAFGSTSAIAQDKAAATTTQQTKENAQKEADAMRMRIEQMIIKIEANKNNDKVAYEAEILRIEGMKKKWEEKSGKAWKEEEKK